MGFFSTTSATSPSRSGCGTTNDQPAPAPRFVGTPGAIRRPPPHPGQYGDEALADWGLDAAEVADLRASGAIR